MTEPYRATLVAVMHAIGCRLRAGLSHECAAELLRDLADDYETGNIAVDPWGPEDSRSPELRAAMLTRRRRLSDRRSPRGGQAGA